MDLFGIQFIMLYQKNLFYLYYKNNIVKLRELYAEYRKVLLKIYINNKNRIDTKFQYKHIFKKLALDFEDFIVRTDVICTYLYNYKWKIKNIIDDGKLIDFTSFINVYCRGDINILNYHLEKINKIKDIDMSEITKITLNTIKEFKKLQNKSEKLFENNILLVHKKS